MKVLISSPNHDAITHYLHAWSKRLESDFSATHTFYHLEGERATKDHVCGILEKRNVDIVLLNGHGADDRIAGHNNEILLDESNVSLLSGKSVHALSCHTAKTLGDLAMVAGAHKYIGYDAPFFMIFQHNHISAPLEDNVANLFLAPAFTAPQALLNNKTAEDAVALTREAYKRSIRQAMNSDVQSDQDKCVGPLYWDLLHLKSC